MIPVERVEPVDHGLPVALARVRSRVGRKPRLVFVEVQRRREPRRELAGPLLVDRRRRPVGLAGQDPAPGECGNPVPASAPSTVRRESPALLISIAPSSIGCSPGPRSD
ncbi:hypothetical protein VB773_02505 [Haloarculaceae archaeon H-GB2-1]|nr:hypothetical protein [Haloarculaceae archaeon H-GB2-1]